MEDLVLIRARVLEATAGLPPTQEREAALGALLLEKDGEMARGHLPAPAAVGGAVLEEPGGGVPEKPGGGRPEVRLRGLPGAPIVAGAGRYYIRPTRARP